jgi:hypothetical protein
MQKSGVPCLAFDEESKGIGYNTTCYRIPSPNSPKAEQGGPKF